MGYKKLFFGILLFITTFTLVSCVKARIDVNFYNEDGTLYRTMKVYTKETINEPDAPYREDAEFLGWYYEDTKYDFSLPILISMDFYAKYKTNNHTISFYVDDTLYLEQSVKTNTFLNEVTDPKREGYVFSGWYDKENNELDIDARIKADAKYYAKFIALEKVVTYHLTYSEYLNVNFSNNSEVLKDKEVTVILDLPTNYQFEHLLVNGVVVHPINNVYKFNINNNTHIEIVYHEVNNDNENLDISKLINYLENYQKPIFEKGSYEINYQGNNSIFNQRFSLNNNLEYNIFSFYSWNNNGHQNIIYKDNYVYKYDNIINKDIKYEGLVDKYLLSNIYDNALYFDYNELNIIIDDLLKDNLLNGINEDFKYSNIRSYGWDNYFNFEIDFKESLFLTNDFEFTKSILKLFNIDKIEGDILFRIEFLNNEINKIEILYFTKDKFDNFIINKLGNNYDINVDVTDSYLLEDNTTKVNVHGLNTTYTNNYLNRDLVNIFDENNNYNKHGYIFNGIYLDSNYTNKLNKNGFKNIGDEVDLYFKYDLVESLDIIKENYLNEDYITLTGDNNSLYFESNNYILFEYDDIKYVYIKDSNKLLYIKDDLVTQSLNDSILSIYDLVNGLEEDDLKLSFNGYKTKENNLLSNNYIVISNVILDNDLYQDYKLILANSNNNLNDYILSIISESVLDKYDSFEIVNDHLLFDINDLSNVVLRFYNENNSSVLIKSLEELKEDNTFDFEYNLENNTLTINYGSFSDTSSINLYDSSRGKVVYNKETNEYDYLNEMRNFFITTSGYREATSWYVDRMFETDSFDELKGYRTNEDVIVIEPLYSIGSFETVMDFIKSRGFLRISLYNTNINHFNYELYYSYIRELLYAGDYNKFEMSNDKFIHSNESFSYVLNKDSNYLTNGVYNNINNVYKYLALLDELEFEQTNNSLYSANYVSGNYSLYIYIYNDNDFHLSLQDNEINIFSINSKENYPNEFSYEYDNSLTLLTEDEEIELLFNYNPYYYVKNDLFLFGNYLDDIYLLVNDELVEFNNDELMKNETYYLKYEEALDITLTIEKYKQDQLVIYLEDEDVNYYLDFTNSVLHTKVGDTTYIVKFVEDYYGYLSKEYYYAKEGYIYDSNNSFANWIYEISYIFEVLNKDYNANEWRESSRYLEYYLNSSITISKSTNNIMIHGYKNVIISEEEFEIIDLSEYEESIDEVISIELNYHEDNYKYVDIEKHSTFTLTLKSGMKVYISNHEISLIDKDTLRVTYNNKFYEFPNNLDQIFYNSKLEDVFIFYNSTLYYRSELNSLLELPEYELENSFFEYNGWQLNDITFNTVEEFLNTVGSKNQYIKYEITPNLILKDFNDNYDSLKKYTILYISGLYAFFNPTTKTYYLDSYIVTFNNEMVTLKNNDSEMIFDVRLLKTNTFNRTFNKIYALYLFNKILDYDYEVSGHSYYNDHFKIDVDFNGNSFFNLNLDDYYIEIKTNEDNFKPYKYTNTFVHEFNIVGDRRINDTDFRVKIRYNYMRPYIENILNDTNYYLDSFYSDKNHTEQFIFPEYDQTTEISIVYVSMSVLPTYSSLISKYNNEKYVLKDSNNSNKIYVDKNNYMYIDLEYATYYYDIITKTLYKLEDDVWEVSNRNVFLTFNLANKFEIREYNYYVGHYDHYSFYLYLNGSIEFKAIYEDDHHYLVQYNYELEDFDYSDLLNK